MTVFKRIVFFLTAFSAAALFLLTCFSNGAVHNFLSFLLAAAAIGLIRLLSRCRLPSRTALWIAASVAVALRVLAIFCFPVGTAPAHDFGSYFRLAQNLAEGGPYIQSSCAFFPHMLFFSMALSVPFRLFGASVLTYQLCNLALSLCALFLLYAILLETAGKPAAFAGALAWAFEPALVLYAPLNCHEHYVLTLTFLYLFLLLRFTQQKSKRPVVLALRGGTLGLCLLALDLVRPLGILFFIATLLWLILRAHQWDARRAGALALAALAFTGVLFGGKAAAFEAANGLRREPLAKASYGFTLLVGSNGESGGTWNGEDSSYFLSLMRENGGRDGYRAANNAVLSKVRTRWTDRSFGENLRFLTQKNQMLWGGQKIVLEYLRLYETAPAGFSSHPRPIALLRLLCDTYLSALLLLSAVTCFSAARNKKLDEGFLLFTAIAFLGFACMHCLTEASGRYTISALSLLLLLAVPRANSRTILKRRRRRE